MSAPTPQPTPAPGAPTPAPAPRRGNSWKYTLALITVLIAGAAGYYFYVRSQNPEPPPVDEFKVLKEYFTRLASHQKLADGYVDADKDLVADAPKDPAKWVQIGDELTFTVVGSDDPAKAAEDWKGLTAALAKATGVKTVRYLEDVRNVEDQIAAVREGRLHVTAFNTGAVPTAVNAAGFVPLFAPADANGKYSYEMEILVPADSPVKTPADLRGKTVGFVALSSNSGAKAAMVVLNEKFDLFPTRDYKYVITGEHIRGVKELIAGKHDAVCVANDLLRRAENDPDPARRVDKTKYRSIYTSESFPPLCFGVPHNLPPEVREKIKSAFSTYALVGSPLGARYAKFAPVNYKKDWEYVRKIDEALTRLPERENR